MSQSNSGDFGASCPTPKPSQAEGEANRTQPNALQPPKPSKAEGEDFRQTSGAYTVGGQNVGGSTVAGSYSAGSSQAGTADSASNPSVTRAASDAGREVKDAARQVAGEASRQASHLASDARNAVASQAAQLQQKGANYVARQKDFLAEEVSHVSAAVRQAAQKLHEEGDDRVASYVDQAASGIEGVGSYFRDRDVSALCDDFESLARRRPEIVYGGLFLAGLGIARFLKASRPRPRLEYAPSYDGTDRYYDDPDTYRDSMTGRNDPYYATAGYMASAVTTRYPESGGEENCNVF